MSNSQWQNELNPVLRTSQIIVGALIAGCTTFLVIALVVAGRVGAAGGQPLVTYAGIVFAGLALIVRVVVPGMINARGRRSIARGTWRLPGNQSARYGKFIERTGDAGKLAILSQTGTIVAAAILEGATFFLMVAHMIDRSLSSLIVAVALIVGLLMHIPTRSRLIYWIEDQLNLLEQERQIGG